MQTQSSPIHTAQVAKSELQEKIEAMPAIDRQWLSENLEYVNKALGGKCANTRKEPQ